MTEAEKAGAWAMTYLCMALFATWFTVACLAWSHIKKWFL